MKLIIDIPEDTVKEIKDNAMFAESIASQIKWDVTGAIVNGIPLDKIRAEIDRQEKWLLQAGYTAYNTDIAFDAIKSVLAESEGRNDNNRHK